MQTFLHTGCGPKHKDPYKFAMTNRRLAMTKMVAAKRREHPYYDLWALGTVAAMGEAELRVLAGAHFP